MDKGARETVEKKEVIDWIRQGPTDVMIVEDETAGGHGPQHTYVGEEPNDVGPGVRNHTPAKPGSPGPM